MARMKVEVLGPGQSDGMTMVTARNANGVRETMVVPTDSVVDGTIDVGEPVDSMDRGFLVNLPVLTVSGHWQMFMAPADVV